MLECFIRRQGEFWRRGNSHHLAALNAYHNREGEPGERVRISVPHIMGGNFVGIFSPLGDSVYQFIDEYGRTVQIMMATPERVAYINRIMDG